MAEETRGVFTLKTVRNNILNDEFVTPEQAFSGVPQGFDTGYNTGGSTPAAVSITDKTNYTTDTTARVPGADLNSGARKGLQGCGSVTAGYYGGGYPASDVVNKMPYSTETMESLPGTLNAARGYLSACSSDKAGYWSGGAPGSNSSTDKCTFSTDTVARAPGANLSVARAFVHATGNTQFGFIGNGFLSPNYYTTMDKLSFAGETLAQAPAASLTVACEDNNASGNGVFGYFAGGFGPGSTKQSLVDKCNFLVDTTSRIPTADLTTAVFKHGQTGTSSAGYASGGQTPARISTTQKINYSTETTAAVPGAALSGVRSDMGTSSSRDNALSTLTQPKNLKSVASPPNFGYFVGGPFNASGTEKIDFVTEVSFKVTTAQLAEDVSAPTGLASPTASYYMGRANGSAMQRITYSDETCVLVPSGQLPQLTGYAAGTNTDAVGYVAGGQGPSSPYRSWIQRVSYSSETSEMMPSGNLVRSKVLPGNFSNMKNGYYVGGDTNFSDCDRLNFSSETVGGVPSGRITNPRGYMKGSGNADAGYTAGGSNGPNGVSYTSRLTYATELMSNIPSAFVANGAEAGAMSGNLTNGYYTSGYDGAYRTYTYRISYTNDYSALVPSAFLQTGNRYLTGTSGRDRNLPQPRPETPTASASIPGSTSNAAYTGGGVTPGPVRYSRVDKTSYSTDTTEFVPGASLTSSSYGVGSASSKTAGYFGGGYYPANRSTVDKLTYSTDSTAAVPGAALSSERRYGAGIGNADAAYFGAGYAAARESRVDKTTYSSDTTARLPAADLSVARYNLSAAGDANAGYFLSGDNGSPYTTQADKVSYSSDTAAALPSANFADAIEGHVGVPGAGIAGYFVGRTGPAIGSIVQKLTYSTDTMSFTGLTLNEQRGLCGGSSNQANGYVFGGINPGGSGFVRTTVEKINLSTETLSQAPGGLSVARYWITSTSARECEVGRLPNVL